MRGALAALVLLALAACGADPPPSAVVISIDALGYGALGAADLERAGQPRLAAFAGRAARFQRALSAAPWTLPAHASLLTGVYPDRHGATDRRRTLDPGLPTLAERLRARGYETVAFTGGGFVSQEFGLARGFAVYDDWSDEPGAAEGASSAPGGAELFAQARAWLAGRSPEDGPFFLFVHTFAVHQYFQERPGAAARADREAPSPGTAPGAHHDCLIGRGACSEATWRRLAALYRAEVARATAGLEGVLTTLEERGLAARSHVWLLSDHGEGLEPGRGRVHHGGRLHEDQLRIPLWVVGPAVTPRKIRTPVSLVDVAPTLLEWAGAEIPAEVEGRSLAGLLAGGPPPDRARPLFAMEHGYRYREGRREDTASVERYPLQVAVLEGRHWYIVDRERRSEELYDMGLDPGQLRDLSGSPSPMLAQLQQAVRGRLAAPRPDSPAARVADRRKAQLRRLGYLE